MNKAGCLFLIGALSFINAAAAQTPAPDGTQPECLTQEQVRGGYARYHVIHGRRCWYASVRRPDRTGERPDRAAVDVNPYGDPIWETNAPAATALDRKPAASGADRRSAAALEHTRSLRSDCEEQALKLDSQEKRAFMKECLSGRR
jgi:hypothetical protein